MKKCLWCVFGLGALMIALLAVGVLPTAEASSGTKIDAIGQQGPYAIGFASYVLTDNSRPDPYGGTGGRRIPVYIWYPVDPETVTASTPRAGYPLDMINMPSEISSSEEWEAMGYDPAYQEPVPSGKGPFPVLLMSSGGMTPAWFLTGYGTRLASHGFVVAIPDHIDDPPWFGWEPWATDHVTRNMWNRPRDLSFVLTDLEQRNCAAGDLLCGAIDPSRVAASGWSVGGYAAIVLAGGDDTVWDIGETDPNAIYYGPIPESVPHTPSLPDPRIKAIVTLDGNNALLKFQELARVKVPTLVLAEEWDTVLTAWSFYPAWQARAHAAFSGHPNYRVDITGTNHYSFAGFCDALNVMEAHGFESIPGWDTIENMRAGLCVGVIPPAEGRAIITRYMLAFLKTNLLGETGYQPMLTPGWALTQETLVEFFETEKRNPNSIYEEWPDFSVYFAHQPGSK